jgi:hypothetical protein
VNFQHSSFSFDDLILLGNSILHVNNLISYNKLMVVSVLDSNLITLMVTLSANTLTDIDFLSSKILLLRLPILHLHF